MQRVSRAGRTGDDEAAGSPSKLRPFLLATIVVAAVAVIATTSIGMQMLALAVGWLGRLPGSTALLPLAGGAALIGALYFLRRRRRSAPVPVRRAFRSQNAEPPREGDPVLQVTGRSAFCSLLQDKLSAHAAEGRQLAVHRIDLERFRQINGRFGREAGDRVLGEVSRRLAELAGDPVRLTRLGDDEFAVIQPEAGGAKHAEIFAARMQKALEDPIAVGETEIPVTASIGIAVAPEQGDSPEALLASADLALEAAQRDGSGVIRCFAAAMAEHRARYRAIEGAVLAALREGASARLALGYRPQYDLASRRLTGFEVKVGLDAPALGRVTETELALAAEAAGLLSAVTERAVREACRTAARWPQHLRLGFNLLPSHFAACDIARLVGEALKANHLSPGRVDLEVDEAFVSAAGGPALDRLRRLAEAGYRLVLDNHGSGHCGPSDLWREPFAAVKIDAGLVGRIGHGDGAEAPVAAMIKLAQALGLEAIADGADGIEQVHFLMLNGCRNVAGPVLGADVAADKVASVIEKDSRNAEAGERAQAAA
jgi:diguanylate cyclase (GGDEF)-like protein